MATTETGKVDSKNPDPDDDINSLLYQQNQELMAAHSLESDLDLAYRLQLQEVFSASISLHTSQPQPPPTPPPPSQPPLQNDTLFSLTSQELSKLQQESLDHKRCVLETQKLKEDLKRRVHDEKFARQIAKISEDQWAEWGDRFERPFGEGCSKELRSEETDGENDAFDDISGDDECEFRIYFKGLISEEKVKNEISNYAGIGVAICDFRDNLILEIKKPLVGVGLSKQVAELKALIEALSAALSLELNRVEFFCDYYPIYQYVTRRWPPKQRKISMLVNQVLLLQRKFTYCSPTLVARNDIKYAFKLAREAIISQVTRPVEQNHGKIVKETCVICLEDTDFGSMFLVDGCKHRYCFSCMKQHVEVKLLHGMVPKCPHEGCKSELIVDSCKNFLTAKMIETLKQRIKEASIPVTEKVYCPYPRCSTLMSRNEVSEYAKDLFVGAERSGARKCLKCHGLFCINCKVPWHRNMTCQDYKRENPLPPAEDLKLKSLASMNLWRQCVKCNHMIELSEGCYHMTCRCGYEFCYNCGAEWKNKKPTCSCPLWVEDLIWHEDRDSDEEDDNDDYEEEEEEEEDSDYDWLHS